METFSAIVTLYDPGESTGQWWIPLTKASDAEFFLCFICSAPEQMVEQTFQTPVISDAIAFVMWWRHCNEMPDTK